jgi:hypothetical protein
MTALVKGDLPCGDIGRVGMHPAISFAANLQLAQGRIAGSGYLDEEARHMIVEDLAFYG